MPPSAEREVGARSVAPLLEIGKIDGHVFQPSLKELHLVVVSGSSVAVILSALSRKQTVS
jgi:hypothetical protein